MCCCCFSLITLLFLFSHFRGGLTNKLTKVCLKPEAIKRTGATPPCVLVRHYGVGTEAFFDRDNEHKE
jgi:hypothetical protein